MIARGIITAGVALSMALGINAQGQQYACASPSDTLIAVPKMQVSMPQLFPGQSPPIYNGPYPGDASYSCECYDPATMQSDYPSTACTYQVGTDASNNPSCTATCTAPYTAPQTPYFPQTECTGANCLYEDDYACPAGAMLSYDPTRGMCACIQGNTDVSFRNGCSASDAQGPYGDYACQGYCSAAARTPPPPPEVPSNNVCPMGTTLSYRPSLMTGWPDHCACVDPTNMEMSFVSGCDAVAEPATAGTYTCQGYCQTPPPPPPEVPSNDVCPMGSSLTYVVADLMTAWPAHCACVNGVSLLEMTYLPGCAAAATLLSNGMYDCQGYCTPAPTFVIAPQPSKVITFPRSEPSPSSDLCPLLCPIKDYLNILECAYPMEDINNCGGCAYGPNANGTDCQVTGRQCVNGRCVNSPSKRECHGKDRDADGTCRRKSKASGHREDHDSHRHGEQYYGRFKL